MARPNSRYFTPVIKKLLEAKRQESIAIDQNLKASLRANIIAKAGGFSVPQKAGQGFDWGRFLESATVIFGKFRYQLAVVPSVLLLIIVAVSAMRMPVNIKSNVTVPVVNPQISETHQPGPIERAVTNPPENAVVQLESAQLNSTQPGLKTFAGRSVLPASYFEKNSEKIQFDTDLLLSEPAYTESENAQAPKIVPTPAAKIYTYVPNEPNAAESGSVSPEEMRAQNYRSISAGDAANTGVPEVITENRTLPVTPVNTAEQRNLPQVRVPSDVVPGLAVPKNIAAMADAAQKDTAANTGYVPNKTSAAAPIMQAVPARQTLPVYYNSDFSEDEKTVFEQDVIVALVANKDVSYVSVSMGPDRVVTVEVYLNDGTKDLKYFMKGANSNVWNQVKYVENYYYDDSLRYEPSMRYVNYDANGYPYEY